MEASVTVPAEVPVFERAATGAESLQPLVAPREYTRSHLRDSLYRRLLAGADAIAILLSLVVALGLLADNALQPAALLVPLLFVIVMKTVGLYERDEHLLHKNTLDEVPTLFAVSSITALVFWLAGGAFVEGPIERTQVVAVWAVLFVSLICLRPLTRAGARGMTPSERCLLVGDLKTAAYVREKLAVSGSVKAELVGVVPAPASDDRVQLPSEIRPLMESGGIDRVILAVGAGGREDLLYMTRELKGFGVKVSVLPEASGIAGSSVELDHLHGMTLLGMRRFEITRSSRLVKRSFDVLGSSLALLITSPLLIAAAIAIRLDSPGPILFRQRRVGRHGREFTMLKFRSMVNEAEQLKDELGHLNEGADGLFKIRDDPRVTRVGRLLRASQLDEMPQLLNVLRGEMSLVGPRPLVQEEDQRIEGWYRRRLEIRPGMTGHWQILGSSSAMPLREMVKLDYLYLANWSLWSDVRLLLRTVPFVVGRRGL